MEVKYLIRLDDACPTMSSVKWQRMEELLSAYGVRPMVGVIPSNADSKLKTDREDTEFWCKVRRWKDMGWAIALHGFDHCYVSNDSGINPLWCRSEFAGVPLDVQKRKITEGVSILRNHGVSPKYFFAPSHTFDENTLIALRECSDIRIISDTIALKPYLENDFIFIPQIGGRCIDMPLGGVYTFCFHPSAMNDRDFDKLKAFLERHKENFCGFDDLKLDSLLPKSILDRFISWLYFTYRKLRRIR